MVCVIIFRHKGHVFWKLAVIFEQVRHRHKCRHGKTKTDFFLSRQTTHAKDESAEDLSARFGLRGLRLNGMRVDGPFLVVANKGGVCGLRCSTGGTCRSF